MTEREILNLALESLKNFKGCLPEHWETFDEQAITYIKEFLEKPEQKPLTDEQISKLAVCGVFHGDAKLITKAIEAAHGIKE